MTLFPLDIPPGVWRNGTQYEAKGRYYDVNLVRWRNGSLRPVGGWDAWGSSNAVTGVPRGIYAWTDNGGNRWLAVGTASGLWVYDDSTNVTDITPTLTAATGTLTLTGNANDTETVTIGSKTYTFQATLTNVDGNVHIGATASDTIDNLVAAITLGAGAGTDYATAMTEHPTVGAAAGAGDTMDVTADTAGLAGNDIGTTETLTNGSWGSTTLTGGSDALVAGVADATLAGGYGEDTYGTGTYGTPRPDTDAITLASTWALDGWGQYLVGCMDGDGDLWEWQLNTAANAAQISNAPTGCLGLVVTQERFLFALGAGGNPRKVDWCDQADNTVWTAATTNQAGSFILETDGEIRCGIKQRGETLILTSTDVWSARYIGAPLVYSFTRLQTGCGAPGNRTAVRIGNNKAVWLGYGGFFVYDGGYVRRLQCDVWDYYLSMVSELQASKIFGWHNVDHSEAWWLIPDDSTNECAFYIAWNYAEDTWTFGSMDRTCGVHRGTFGTPMLMDADGLPYQHETSWSHGGDTPYAETGPVEIGSGERRMHAVRLIPDEATLGETQITFKTREYPTATETSHGPYSMANPTDVRFSGRQALVRIEATGSTDWRVGVPRLEVKAGGKR